jgi:hypothetical protein
MSNTTRLPGSPYDLGYGKPPKDSQFAAGRSGNPKGRPKGSANLAAALNRALKEKVEIVEHGRRKSITKLDAAVKAMVNRAVKGDAKAAANAGYGASGRNGHEQEYAVDRCQ